MGDPLSDCSPLIGAASSGKLRLVRLLVEGGAQVNSRGPAGETPLLAACKALRGEPAGRGTLRLLTFLLHNKVGLLWVMWKQFASKTVTKVRKYVVLDVFPKCNKWNRRWKQDYKKKKKVSQVALLCLCFVNISGQGKQFISMTSG